MNKNSTGARMIILKAVCTAMVLILGGSLFAAGVMASNGCAMKCCCQTDPVHMQPATEIQMRSLQGCCSGVPFNPCDVQSANPFELHEIIPASCCHYHFYTSGISAVLIDAGYQNQNTGAELIFQVLSPKLKSPPLYLQNLSLLI